MTGVNVLLKHAVSSQFAVTRMVGEGKISMQAAFITNYIIMKSVERLIGSCAVPATEIRDAMGVSSPSVGYKYVNEAIDAGLLQVIKSAGMTNVYRPMYENILAGFDTSSLCNDEWLSKARKLRKDESADIHNAWFDGEHVISGNLIE